MKSSEFDKGVEECIEIIRKSLKSKGEEYTQGNQDRLANFKRAAAMKQTTPEDVLLGYYLKHITSIFDMIDKLTEENKKVSLIFTVNPIHIGITKKQINEKIKDLANYPIILKMLLKERMGND